jgi:radical SAM superfamily enzyme YgiQ (UPF0313 family)
MRVLLISANTELSTMVPLPLGLNCVAVATRNAGHAVRMLDLMGGGDSLSLIREAVAASAPGVIGISVRNIDDQNRAQPRFLLQTARNTITICRDLSAATIVVGGAGYSIFPEAALRYLQADFGICGDGEVAFPALLRALERDETPCGIAGLWRPGAVPQGGTAARPELGALPLPDPALWTVPAGLRPETWLPFQTRRGCPMGCSYCSTPVIEGTVSRQRPIVAVLHGLAEHVAAGFQNFYFVDSTFNLPPSYARELCAALGAAGLGIRWRCILYPGFVDADLVKKMAAAGCVEASLGFESGCPAMLRNFNKQFDLNQVRTAVALLRDHGIRRTGFLLLGGPGETRDSVQESLAFADSLALDLLKLTTGIRIYPGTALERAARQEGLITPGDDLLMPRFYLAPGLEGWIEPMLCDWMQDRPWCTT